MTWTGKDPHSSEFFALDFSLLLTDGDTVSAVNGLTLTGPDSVLVAGSAALNGSAVVFRLSGGTLGATYQVRADITTAAGELLSMTGVLLVRVQQ